MTSTMFNCVVILLIFDDIKKRICVKITKSKINGSFISYCIEYQKNNGKNEVH